MESCEGCDNMPPEIPRSNMDIAQSIIRFADEDDAEDMATLINAAYHCEECLLSSNSAVLFRKPSEKISLDEVMDNVEYSNHIRWVVQETIAPLDDIIGCLRFRVYNGIEDSNGRPNTATIDLFCCTPLHLPSGQTCCKLLAFTEKILVDLGINKVIIPIPQYREDLVSFASDCGYEDRGGECVGLEEDTMYLKPTMIFSMTKELQKEVVASASTSVTSVNTPVPSVSADGLANLLNSAIDASTELKDDDSDDDIFDVGQYSIVECGVQGDNGGVERIGIDSGSGSYEMGPLEGAMVDLFDALHREYGDDANATSPQIPNTVTNAPPIHRVQPPAPAQHE